VIYVSILGLCRRNVVFWVRYLGNDVFLITSSLCVHLCHELLHKLVSVSYVIIVSYFETHFMSTYDANTSIFGAKKIPISIFEMILLTLLCSRHII